MFNRYIIDSDTFQNLDKRREVRRKLAKQMIINSHSTKFKKFCISFSALLFGCWVVGIHAGFIIG